MKSDLDSSSSSRTKQHLTPKYSSPIHHMFPTRRCSTITPRVVLIPAAPMIVKWSVFPEEGTARLPSCRSKPTESASASSPNLCAIGWIAMFPLVIVPHSRMLPEARMDRNIALNQHPPNVRRAPVKSVASANLWSIALQNIKKKTGMSTSEFVSKHSVFCCFHVSRFYVFLYFPNPLPQPSILHPTVTILYINL